MEALVLDFDGVIADSAPEVFIGALRTYAALRPASALVARSAFRRWLADGDPERLPEDDLYRAFLEIMPLGNRAEDFGVALDALDAGREIADQRSYDAHYEALERKAPGFLQSFHRHFYALRDQARKADPDAWARLSRPYRSFVDLLERRRGDVQLAIATSKDGCSVRDLLCAYGIDRLFPPEAVLDKEVSADKRVHLECLADRLSLPFEEITFIDDKVNHLERVRGLGVRCGLAAWGYNSRREHDEARQRGYLVCTLEDVERQLFA